MVSKTFVPITESSIGDRLVLLIDQLPTGSTLEAAIKKCRICQDEDVDSNMETPCSCCGSLKYAHRKCIQRWCDEKGDTVCEICRQEFKPGYTAPTRIIHIGGLPMNLRGNWHIGRRELNNPHIITMVSTNSPSFLDRDYDEYAVSTSRSMSSCHSVAIIFMLLLILRHTLLAISVMLRAAGMILPVCMILIAVTSTLRHLSQQANASMSLIPSDEEAGPLHQSLGAGILCN